MARKKDFIRPTNGAGAPYTTYAMNTMRYAGIGDNELRTDVRHVGDTVVTMRRNQSSPPHVEATIPTTKLEPKTCPKGDYGFLDLVTFGAGSADGPTSSTESLYATYDETGAVKETKYLKNTSDQKAFFRTYLPSLYTGGMRRVMQIVQGMGMSEVQSRTDLWDAVNQRLRIQPGYYVTHGVFIGSNQKRWIIEIGYAGIFRIPVEFCTKLPSNWRALHTEIEASGWPAAHKKLARYWTPVRINWAAYEQIGDVPVYYTNGETPLYGTCGWAFDSDGHNAVNVGVRIDPDDPLAARRRATLYTATVTEDADGNPGHATCLGGESGELTNHFNDTDPNQGPAVIQVANTLRTVDGLHGYCTTFSCYPGTVGPRLYSTATPVFAYYDPDDDLHVVRFTPIWDVANTNTSVSYEAARASYAASFDILTGDTAQSSAVYGGDPAWPFPAAGYNSAVLGATWGSSARTDTITMRFTSPLVAPCPQTYFDNKVESGLLTYGGSFLAAGSYSLITVLIDWSFQSTNLTTGDVSTYRDCRIASLDNSASTRVSAIGVISVTETYTDRRDAHQVLVLHGYDRTSYAVYTRTEVAQEARSTTYGGTNMAVPDSASFEYNGIWSSNTWTAHSPLSVYDADYIVDNPGSSPDHHVVRTTVGGSKFPGSMVIYRPDGANTVTPPVGVAEPDSVVTIFSGSVVVGGAAYTMDITGTDMEEVYLLSDFFYKAGGSFVPTRAFYQLRENMTPSQVVGMGGLATANAHVNGFVGYF
jgi:hypothetical protein